MLNPEDRYKAKERQVRDKINLIRKKLERHKKKFGKNPRDWGYVGDLTVMDQELSKLIGMLR